VLEEDPLLDDPRHLILVEQLKKLSKGSFNWGVIS
jgi:hypothetical protein